MVFKSEAMGKCIGRLLKKARLLTLPPWRAETRQVPSKAAASE